MQDKPVLEQLWHRICNPSGNTAEDPDAGWEQQVRALYAHQIAHPVALRYLLEQRPSLSEFLQWVVQSAAGYQVLDAHAENDQPAGTDWRLTPEQLAFWHENGYLVLPAVIDRQACAETCDAICDFLGIQQHDPASWHLANQKKHGLMMPLYDHPRINTNRESGRIRAAYEQLYGSTAIYKTIDHLSFNPPVSAETPFSGSDLHWDVSLAQPVPEKFQGLLYLTDCGAEEGAFHCVPGFHRVLADWLQQVPAGLNPREYAAATLVPEAVPGNAGDFVIWHQALPHCATPNFGSRPRMVQYLTYIRDDHKDHDIWI